MKIIKQRKDHLAKKYSWICRKCGSEIEALEQEGKITYDHGNLVSFMCPVCQQVAHLSLKLGKNI